MRLITLLAIDVGLCGAMVVIRNVGNGPEPWDRPHRWRYANRAVWERQGREAVEDYLRVLLRTHVPEAVALEEPISVLGRKAVGVSQAEQVGRFSIICGQAKCKPQMVVVPGQHGEAPGEAWGVLKQSFGELLSREEMAELAGPAGEHVRDACAVALAGLARMEGRMC